MADFRSQLYERYVSTFKSRTGTEDEANLESHRAWCRFKILPLLNGVDRSAPLVELGCGSGNLLRLLADEGYQDVLGVDLSEEMVALATGRGVPAEAGDAQQFLASAAGRYRVIVALDFIEHFTKGELMEILPRILDRLEPGGLLLLQTPNGQGLFPNQVVYGDLTHMTIFNPESLAQLLRLVGFTDIACHETGPVPKNVVGIVRVALWKLVCAGAAILRRIETGKAQTIWTENLLCTARKPDV